MSEHLHGSAGGVVRLVGPDRPGQALQVGRLCTGQINTVRLSLWPDSDASL